MVRRSRRGITRWWRVRGRSRPLGRARSPSPTEETATRSGRICKSLVTFSRRRQMAGVFGVTSGALLAACAPFPDGAPAVQPTAKAKTPAALTLSHRWDGDLREPAVESQLRGFREAHPHLTVTVSVGRESALVTSAAGLSGDVAMLHSNEAAPLAAGGALVTLEAHLIKEGTKP